MNFINGFMDVVNSKALGASVAILLLGALYVGVFFAGALFFTREGK